MKRSTSLVMLAAATFCCVCAYVAKECGEEYERLFPSWSPTGGGIPNLHTDRAAPRPVSGASPAHPHPLAHLVNAEPERSAPESQIITPPPSRSPVMDRLIPQKAQNRALGSAGDRQVENARQVERLLWAKGYREPKAIVAILANGWHESRWKADVVHKEKNGTVSRGFFQLTNGALTIEGNVEQLTTKAPYAARIQKWYADAKKHNWDAGTAAYYFAARVEICAKRFWNERKQTADKWWRIVEGE